MDKNVKFMALGGAQSIGESCYFLKLGSNNILLDCGAKKIKGIFKGPEFLRLYESGLVDSPKNISEIFISHAHMDHIGYLEYLISDIGDTPIYMTEVTKVLSDYQFYGKLDCKRKLLTTSGVMLKEKLLNKIISISYLQKIYNKEYNVEFYPAGHIPGAMMTLIEYQGRNILYTGDYSLKSTLLTNGCYIPQDKNVDVLIVCATHAKHANYINENTLENKIKNIFWKVRTKKYVNCSVSQLSKGVEILKYLNNFKKKCGIKIPIYIDESIWKIIEKLEESNVNLLEDGNYYFHSEKLNQPYIRISNERDCVRNRKEYTYNMDFTLHDNFADIITFIKQINPKTAIVVHSSQGMDWNSTTIEQILMYDPDCRTQFIFPEVGEIYTI